MVRVRFAPSPTGFLHIGGLRTALYNYLYAKRHGGVFVLRLEDTDRTRFVEGADVGLVKSLAQCGLAADEGVTLSESGEIAERGEFGPYVQSKRLDIYREHVDKLLSSGMAYHCFCSAERLAEVRLAQQAAKEPVMYDRKCRDLSSEEAEAKKASGEPYVIRLSVPLEGKTEFTDITRGEVSFENALIDDQVLLKSDGFPTYHLANVVDDHLMQITHVIRGEEWVSSTPKHVLLYKAFGWEVPQFAHLPLLLNSDKSKLSKRQGDVAVEDYLANGYLPEALVNFVALLGWNPTGDREVYEMRELESMFDLTKVNKGGAVFNRDKLDWLNKEYVRAMDPEKLAELAVPFFLDSELLRREGESFVSSDGYQRFSFGDIIRAVTPEQARITLLSELPEATEFLFKDIVVEAEILPWKKSTPEEALDRLIGLREWLAEADEKLYNDAKAMEAAVLALVVEKGWKNAESLWPLRVSLTGRTMSPSPFEVLWALGKARSLDRIDQAIKRLS